MEHADVSLHLAILDAPADDAPRLLFAAWLEERGDVARAEFIRAQVEREKLQESDPRRADLEMRERELLETRGRLPNGCLTQRLGVIWAGAIPRIAVSYAHSRWTFRRGFVGTVTLHSEVFLRQAADLFRAAPIGEVRLRDKAPATDSAGQWVWRRDDATAAGLPPSLFDRLPSGLLAACREFNDRAAALDALSQACVAHGREVAGLRRLDSSRPAISAA